jgi:predicted transcriptional regulator
VSKRKSAARKKDEEQPGEIASPVPSTLGGQTFGARSRRSGRGTGQNSAGQAGDIQGLSRKERVDSESVEELVEEGQFHEAEVISGIEDALDPDQGEVRTHEVPENDVPEEYLKKEND